MLLSFWLKEQDGRDHHSAQISMISYNFLSLYPSVVGSIYTSNPLEELICLRSNQKTDAGLMAPMEEDTLWDNPYSCERKLGWRNNTNSFACKIYIEIARRCHKAQNIVVTGCHKESTCGHHNQQAMLNMCKYNAFVLPSRDDWKGAHRSTKYLYADLGPCMQLANVSNAYIAVTSVNITALND